MCLTSTTRQHVKNAFHHAAGFLFSVCMSLFASSSHRVAIAKLTFVCTASTGGSGFLEGFCRHFSVYISLQMTEDFRRLQTGWSIDYGTDPKGVVVRSNKNALFTL